MTIAEFSHRICSPLNRGCKHLWGFQASGYFFLCPALPSSMCAQPIPTDKYRVLDIIDAHYPLTFFLFLCPR